jgi:hypothetical protein
MAAAAQTSVNDFTFSVDQTIPDGNVVGLMLDTDISIPAATGISSLMVALDITGGFNGDLYAHLVGQKGFKPD